MQRFLIWVFVFCVLGSSAQELNCTVDINFAQVNNSVDVTVFQKMKKDISDFVNSRKWTNHVYALTERIECNMFITIKNVPTADRYEATLQLQSSRPIYGTTYKSTLFDVNDNDFNFNYSLNQNLDYSDNDNISNLTSVLAYYAYMVLAFDYDSYSLKGGADYFQKAQNVVNNCLNSAESGWKANDGTKNRYWLIENLMNPVYDPIHTTLYNYHRLGLDIMSTDIAKGRQVIIENLKTLQAIQTRKPSAYSMKVFFDAKNREIVNIFSDESVPDKQPIVDFLSKVDPGNISRYAKIVGK